MSIKSPTRASLLVLLCLAQLMVILDISAVNIALPDLAGDLDIPAGDLPWTITAYSLAFGSLLLLGGRAADLVGRRRTFLLGLATFTTFSLVTAVAGSAGILYASRAGQGIGAAMLSPAALSIITTTFVDREARAKALGAWGAVGAAGGAIGVLLGGVLTEWVDWRAIFFINLPIGIVLAVGVLRAVPADPKAPVLRGLDLRGALTATASLGVLLYAIAGAGEAGWTSTRTLGLAVAGLAGLLGFAALELRAARPLVRLGRLTERPVGGGLALMLPAAAVLMGSFLLTSIYLQEVLGTSALGTGLAFLPIAVAVGAGAHGGSHIVHHLGVRGSMVAAFALTGIGTLLLSRLDAGGSYAGGVLPGMLIAGVGLGIAMVTVAISVLTAASEDDAGMLSGLSTTGHEVGGSLGVATFTSIIAGAIGTSASHPVAGELATGVGDAFLVAAGISAAGMILSLILLPTAARFLPMLRDAPGGVSIH